MYCRNCGNEVDANAKICVKCGSELFTGKKYCKNCGSDTDPNATFCTKCGFDLNDKEKISNGEKTKLAAGLLGIFLGTFGIHNFYLGYTNRGVIQLVLGIMGVITCGITSIISGIWGFVEGIMIFTGSISKDGKGGAIKE